MRCDNCLHRENCLRNKSSCDMYEFDFHSFKETVGHNGLEPEHYYENLYDRCTLDGTAYWIPISSKNSGLTYSCTKCGNNIFVSDDYGILPRYCSYCESEMIKDDDCMW